MVKNIAGLGGSGVTDWLVQRISAVIIGFYVLFLLAYMGCQGGVEYSQWQALFHNPLMRIFSVLALLSLLAHAWIGIWTIVTDYIKCAVLRGCFHVLVILALLSCVIWGVMILWGVS